MSTIVVEGLTKSFGPGRGVFDVGFAVERGEIFGFIGPNGAGKTTLIRILMSYIRPQSGSAAILGLDCRRDAVAIRRRLGYVPAEFKLDEDGRADAHLKHMARFHGRASYARAINLAERFALPLGGRIKTFSKGMKQKVALIQALMHEPEVLILDEPGDGLDPLQRHALNELLREAVAAGGTVFLSSHALADVESLCDRAAVIGAGKLLAVDSLSAMRARRPRVLKIRFAGDGGPPPLPGATHMEMDGNHHVYAHVGEPGPLLAALAALDVGEFSFEPAPLEDVVLGFYK